MKNPTYLPELIEYNEARIDAELIFARLSATERWLALRKPILSSMLLVGVGFVGGNASAGLEFHTIIALLALPGSDGGRHLLMALRVALVGFCIAGLAATLRVTMLSQDRDVISLARYVACFLSAVLVGLVMKYACL